MNLSMKSILVENLYVILKPLNENQQYKKQLEICFGYVSFSLYDQSEKQCNHKSD